MNSKTNCNIEGEFIPYELALEMKKLGFDWPCFGSWEVDYAEIPTYTHCISNFYKNSNHPMKKVTAPTFSQCFNWFREKYNLLLDVVMFYDENQLPLTYKNLQKPKGYFVWDCYDENFNEEKATKFDTYKEAEIECLKKLIEICKAQKITFQI